MFLKIKNNTKMSSTELDILNDVKVKYMSPRQALLDFVVKHNGEIELPKTLFRNSWQIRKIRAVYFNEKFDIEQDDKWNAYVDRIRVAIGVDCYCEWVRNKDGDIIGIMAFYNSKGDEIKVKHFDKWNQLWQDVQRHLRSGVQIVETKTSCQNSTLKLRTNVK
jgi:hypothetical protein